MPHQLTPELLSDVFRFLRIASDTASLRACMVVDPLFSCLAEPHLYHHITLCNDHGKGTPNAILDSDFDPLATALTPQQAIQFLHRRPHTAVYIKSLRISIEILGGMELTSLLGDEAITCVLPLLPALERVELSIRSCRMFFWEQLDNGFKGTFSQVLQQTSVKEIDIRGIQQFPLEVLSFSPQLVRLSLSGSFCYGTQSRGLETSIRSRRHSPVVGSNPQCFGLSSTASHGSQVRAQLKSLSLQQCTSSLPHIILWLYSSTGPEISHLTHLKVTVQCTQDYEELPYILSACQNSLKELDLDPGREANVWYRSPELREREQAIEEGHTRFQHFEYSTLLRNHRLPRHLFSGAPYSITIKPPPLLNSSLASASVSGSNSMSCSAPMSITMPTRFSLSSLASLKNLRLELYVQIVQEHRTNRLGTNKQAFSTGFDWAQRILEEISVFDGDAKNGKAGTLKVLTLDITFSLATDPRSWCDVHFSDLALILSSFNALLALERVEIRLGICDDLKSHVPILEDTCSQDDASFGDPGCRIALSKVMRAMEEGEEMGDLIKKGLVMVCMRAVR